MILGRLEVEECRRVSLQMLQVRSIPGSQMILLDQASSVGSDVNTFCKFRFSTFIVFFVEWYVSCRCQFSDTCC